VSTIPYTGARGFAGLARRTRLVRGLLLALLVAGVCAALAAARAPRIAEPPFLPPAAGGVVVLDLSASITSDTYSRIHETLEQLVARGGSYGLVLFSSVPYEALPPGTPASALAPLARYFTVPNQTRPGLLPTFPNNPWNASFTSGTEISAALDLARTIVLSEHTAHPAVLLISDLADDPDDIQRLTAVLGEYHAEGVALRAIALNAAPNDAEFFQRLIGKASAVIPASLSGPRMNVSVPPPTTSFPTVLVVLCVLVALLLAAHELWTARLRFGRAERVS
jgi:hypothetical protein